MKTLKICMVGAFSVGKTSLVNRFVSSIFNDKYHTTIGVKISKKVVEFAGEQNKLMLWDLEGVDAFTDLNTSYLRGAAGVILVIDGTRLATFSESVNLKAQIENTLNSVPIVTLINKSDLEKSWQMDEESIESIAHQAWHPIKTSAKTGENVEQAFEHLIELIYSAKGVQ